jgi:hypothetical protein
MKAFLFFHRDEAFRHLYLCSAIHIKVNVFFAFFHINVKHNTMANIDHFKVRYDDKEQKGNKNTTKVVIITSIDDDNDKILSYLNPSNGETFIVDINDTNLMDGYQIHNRNNKRSFSQTV